MATSEEPAIETTEIKSTQNEITNTIDNEDNEINKNAKEEEAGAPPHYTTTIDIDDHESHNNKSTSSNNTISDVTTSHDENTHLTVNTKKPANINKNKKQNSPMLTTIDTMRWIRFGENRATTPEFDDNGNEIDTGPCLEELYGEYIKHLRHASGYKAEFDIYQILAYRAKVRSGAKTYFKPFKTLGGMVGKEWSEMKVRWLTTYQRVLCQAVVCFAIQTLGVTAILITQFASYWSDQSSRAQCDWHPSRWKSEFHLKLLAFLWTSFISLGVSGWVYKARHSGFYPILLFKDIEYPSFVSITILQIGLLTNYYVVASSVFGSYILIYQTEGGTETIGMVLQAVALFFVLELDNKIVHARDFLSIYKYFDSFIKHNKHTKLPSKNDYQSGSTESFFQKKRKKCNGQSCLQGTLSITAFFLLVVMTIGAMIAPWLIMICW